MSSLKPEDLRAQASFWQKYGTMILGAGALGVATIGSYLWFNADSPSSKAASKGVTQLSLPYRDSSSASDLIYSDLFNKLTLDDLDWDGKRVLMRTDYNVVINKHGYIEDTTRIDHTLPTIRRLLNDKKENGGVKCIVIISHLGRPAGNFNKADFSLEPIVRYLKHCLGPKVPVEFLPDCVGDAIVERTKTCTPGTVFLCENLRFHIEEIGTGIVNDKEVKASPEAIRSFCDQLSHLGDCFVFESYGAAHRPHASIVGINLPERVAGLCMQQELNVYGHLLTPRHHPNPAESVKQPPKSPFVVVIGSAMKVRDKIKMIEKLVDLADEMIVTGGMAFTFKTVIDPTVKIGTNLIDIDAIPEVERIVKRANERGFKIHLADDHQIAESLDPDAPTGVASDVSGIPEGWLPLDIGPKSRSRFSAVLGRARTILWIGTVGCFEWGSFSAGTVSILNDLVEATQKGALTVIAGGDSSTAARRFVIGKRLAAEQVSFVSSGGGSSLCLLEGKSLHGAARLTNKTFADASK